MLLVIFLYADEKQRPVTTFTSKNPNKNTTVILPSFENDEPVGPQPSASVCVAQRRQTTIGRAGVDADA